MFDGKHAARNPLRGNVHSDLLLFRFESPPPCPNPFGPGGLFISS
ncbi:hypothetical protein PROHIGD21-1_23 [Mycobacterium phage prophiGD21-1]|nr:hypothetical protein PHIGD21-1_61 [Mycobacterium phage phiGD21-1]QST90586.1 hypothetical protein PROHIGD21-1_23 [Mycobacterium phage prophiGD21-1]